MTMQLAIWILLLGAPATAAVSDPERSAVELVELYCHSEYDAPESAEYQACSQGIERLQQELEKDPRDLEKAASLLAALRNRSPEKGLALARRMLEVDPENAAAHLYLGEYGEAPGERLQHLERAAELEPDHPRVHGLLAWLRLVADDDAEAAVAAMERQVEVAPDAYSGLLRRFLGELAHRGRAAERKTLLLACLRADLRPAERCRWFRNLVDPEREDKEVRETFEATCEHGTMSKARG